MERREHPATWPKLKQVQSLSRDDVRVGGRALHGLPRGDWHVQMDARPPGSESLRKRVQYNKDNKTWPSPPPAILHCGGLSASLPTAEDAIYSISSLLTASLLL